MLPERPKLKGRVAHTMRVLRLTTRRWMVIVATIAVSLGGRIQGIRWKRWWDKCSGSIRFHSHLETDIQPSCSYGCPHCVVPTPNTAYHARIRQAYERLATNPWEPLPDDPLKVRWEQGDFVCIPNAANWRSAHLTNSTGYVLRSTIKR